MKKCTGVLSWTSVWTVEKKKKYLMLIEKGDKIVRMGVWGSNLLLKHSGMILLKNAQSTSGNISKSNHLVAYVAKLYF